MEWTCDACGESHDGIPESLVIPEPDPYLDVPEAERARRTEISSDTCVIDDEHFFVLGCLEIPVRGHADPFAWLAWSTLSLANFERTLSLWKTAGRESEPPYFGWLSSRIPGYPDTMNLECRVRTRAVGQRPLLELEPTDHPLAVDQREGIPVERLREIVERAMRG